MCFILLSANVSEKRKINKINGRTKKRLNKIISIETNIMKNNNLFTLKYVIQNSGKKNSRLGKLNYIL
jgi:hypothetical protein